MAEIIDFGALTLRRKQRDYIAAPGVCLHKHLELDPTGEIVRCTDCQQQVSAWWALNWIAHEWEQLNAKLQRERNEVAVARDTHIHLIAARRLEKVWQGRKHLPCCPHCGRGIAPADGLGSTTIAVGMEQRRRAAEASSGASAPSGSGRE